jgi:hypothetical protein
LTGICLDCRDADEMARFRRGGLRLEEVARLRCDELDAPSIRCR